LFFTKISEPGNGRKYAPNNFLSFGLALLLSLGIDLLLEQVEVSPPMQRKIKYEMTLGDFKYYVFWIRLAE